MKTTCTSSRLNNSPIALLLLTFVFVLFIRPASAETKDNTILQKNVTLSVNNQSIREIFAVIGTQTGAVFSYDPQSFNASRKVSLHVEAPIADVLTQLLPPCLTFKATGVYIILHAPQKNLPAAVVAQEPLMKDKRDTACLPLKKISSLSSGEINHTCHSTIIFKNNEAMKKQTTSFSGFFLALLASITPLTAQPVTATAADCDKVKPVQLSLVSPLGIYWHQTPQYTYGFSANIIGGHTGGIRGAEFAGVFNINKQEMRGSQFAGVFNRTNGAVQGAQFAGIFNHSSKVAGAQFAGIYNYAGSGQAAMQAAGVVNVSNENSIVQAAGICNNTRDTAQVQLAGIANMASHTVVQAAGVFNKSAKAGVQLAGVVNMADSSTTQIAGVVNVTRRGGFQLGVVNVRDTADGYMLGLVNIARRGGLLEVEAATGDFGFLPAAVSFRSGRERLYSIVTIGRNFNDNYWVYGFGVGTAFRFSQSLGMNLEAVFYTLLTDHCFNSVRHNNVHQLRPVFYWKTADHFQLFAGPTFNLYTGSNSPDNPIDFRISYSSDRLDRHTAHTRFAAWAGFTAGVRF